MVLPAIDGPVHRYMESSPSCWAVYGETLAREYSDPAFMAAHRLTVDAYAVQHPGQKSDQSVQSVAVHLISLHAVLVEGLSHRAATQVIQRSADHLRFEWLEPPAQRGELSVSTVHSARTAEEHVAAVHAWANSVRAAWAGHHSTVAAWYRQARAK